MANEEVTPIRQQYLEIKRDYPNTILFFRLGDFYETFDEDAEITARELDIVLTSRPVGHGVRAPLAGIPYHAVESYLSRLIEKGYHVAICEQMGDQPIKGIFPRKVVRVVTPGTITEPGLLPGDSNNYLAAVYLENAQAAIAYSDITTGEFAVTELPIESLRAEIVRLHAAEIIHADNQSLESDSEGHLTPWTAWRFETGKCEEVLLAHFKAATLEGFGLKDKSLAIRAAGALLQYLSVTQPDSLSLLTSLRSYNLNEFMTLDSAARRNLELDETLRGELNGSLLGLLDKTVTPMGKRLIHQWVSQPLLDLNKINARLDGTEFFVDHGLERAELRSLIKRLSDLERLTNRILSGHALPRELVGLRDTLNRIQEIIILIERVNGMVQKNDAPFPSPQPCGQELKLLNDSISDDPPVTLQNTGIIRPGYSQELDSALKSSQHARDWIANLESSERARTGIKTLKVGYNKVFGYFIEISRGAAERAPEDYIRKQTLVNAERFITPEMKEYETQVLNAEDHIREIEVRLFREVCKTLSKSANTLLASARALAELDVLSTLAEAAALGGFTRPEIVEGSELEISAGRHPVVEQSLRTDRYVPNDVIFEKGEIVRVITGPNMSGKCVSGDTLISTEKGLASIASLMPPGTPVGEFRRLNLVIPGRDHLVNATDFYNGGYQNTIRIRTRSGFGLEGTPEHLIWARNQDGIEAWSPLAEIQPGAGVLIFPGRGIWKDRRKKAFEYSRLIGDPRGLAVMESQETSQDETFFDTVKTIEASKAEVYDLSVPDGHAFIANGFLCHNSTYLRQTALIVLMAQMGSFVPAGAAKIGLVDRIFTRIGAQDEIHAGQSTFMVEMIEAANILHHATPRSLLILDEIGRGTSTYDGVSIAWAMIEYIHNHPHLRAKTLFATHYHELTQLADLLPGVRNYNVAVAEADGKVVFLHKIVPGGADKSYGIHVAQLAGLPGPVVQRANEIMAELEKSSGRAIRMDPHSAQQAALFPETSPLLDELGSVDINSLSPIEALNKLFEWRKKYLK